MIVHKTNTVKVKHYTNTPTRTLLTHAIKSIWQTHSVRCFYIIINEASAST